MSFKIYHYFIGVILTLIFIGYAASLNTYFVESRTLKTDKVGRLPNKGVNALAFSPDDRFIAAGDGTRFISLMDRRGRPLWQYSLGLGEGHKITAVAAAAGGRRVAAGGIDGVILILDRYGEPLGRFEVDGAVAGLGLSRDGRRLMAATATGNIYRFKRDGLLSQTNLSTPIEKLETDLSGRTMLISNGAGISLFDNDRSLWSKPGFKAASLSASGDRILAWTDKDRLNLLDRSGHSIWSRRQPRSLSGAKEISLSISGDNYAVTADSLAILLDAKGKRLAVYRLPAGDTARAALTESGRRLALGSNALLLIKTSDAIEAPRLQKKISVAILPSVTALFTLMTTFSAWRWIRRRLNNRPDYKPAVLERSEDETERLAA